MQDEPALLCYLAFGLEHQGPCFRFRLFFLFCSCSQVSHTSLTSPPIATCLSGVFSLLHFWHFPIFIYLSLFYFLKEQPFGGLRINKNPRPLGINKLCSKDEESIVLNGLKDLAVPPLFPQPKWLGTLLLPLKRSSYPMITEEAGLALTHKPPHQAHPLTLGVKGLESTVLNIFKDT